MKLTKAKASLIAGLLFAIAKLSFYVMLLVLIVDILIERITAQPEIFFGTIFTSMVLGFLLGITREIYYAFARPGAWLE